MLRWQDPNSKCIALRVLGFLHPANMSLPNPKTNEKKKENKLPVTCLKVFQVEGSERGLVQPSEVGPAGGLARDGDSDVIRS